MSVNPFSNRPATHPKMESKPRAGSQNRQGQQSDRNDGNGRPAVTFSDEKKIDRQSKESKGRYTHDAGDQQTAEKQNIQSHFNQSGEPQRVQGQRPRSDEQQKGERRLQNSQFQNREPRQQNQNQFGSNQLQDNQSNIGQQSRNQKLLLKPNQYQLDFKPQFIQRVKTREANYVYLIDNEQMRVLRQADKDANNKDNFILVNKFVFTMINDLPLLLTGVVQIDSNLFISSNAGLLYVNCQENKIVKKIYDSGNQIIRQLHVEKMQEQLYISFVVGDIGFEQDMPVFANNEIKALIFSGSGEVQPYLSLTLQSTYIQGMWFESSQQRFYVICQQESTFIQPVTQPSVYGNPFGGAAPSYQTIKSCQQRFQIYEASRGEASVKIQMVRELQLPLLSGNYDFVSAGSQIYFSQPWQQYFYEINKEVEALTLDDLHVLSIGQPIVQLAALADGNILIQSEAEVVQVLAKNGKILNSKVIQRRLQIGQCHFQLDLVGFNGELFACVYRRKGYDNYVEDLQEQVAGLEQQLSTQFFSPALQLQLQTLTQELAEAQKLGHIVLVTAKVPKPEYELVVQEIAL